jgi:hypothetical protein
LQQQHENRNKENVSTRSLENRHSTFNNKLIAMSIPEKVENAAWHGNWQDEEEPIHGILEKPPVDAQHRRPNGSRRLSSTISKKPLPGGGAVQSLPHAPSRARE